MTTTLFGGLAGFFMVHKFLYSRGGFFHAAGVFIILAALEVFPSTGWGEQADKILQPEPQASAPPSEETRDGRPPQYGDVLMRGLKVLRSADDGSGHDTLATAKAFGVNRIEWLYDPDEEFVKEANKQGITVSAAMSPNIYDEVIKEIPNGVDKFTIRDLAGNQVVMSHTRAWTDYQTKMFVPDMADGEFTSLYINYVAGLVEKGFPSLHRDDGGNNLMMLREGGSFSAPSIAFFREYLRKKYTGEELKKLGVEDIDKFDVREHFLSLGAPVGKEFWKWRGSPLVDDFRQAMRDIVAWHWQKVREGVSEKTGKKVVFSGHILEWDEIGMQFDYGIAELLYHFIQPLAIYDFARRARQAGKVQCFLLIIDENWQEKPDYREKTRRAISLCYAFGVLPFVPWDQYMSPKVPRYFGTPEEYADLFLFVRKNRELFDKHEEVFVTGWDSSSGLYQWAPNQLLGPEPVSPLPPVRLNSRTMLASVRKVPGQDGSATVHLVDWAMSPRPTEVTIDPKACVGSKSARISLLQPGREPVDLGVNVGATIEIPALNPWAILKVEAISSPADAGVPAPSISGAPRGLLASGTPIELVGPQGAKLFYKLGQSEDAWKPYQGPVTIDKSGQLIAKTVQPGGGKESGQVRANIQVFDDFRSVADSGKLTRVGLQPLFQQDQGLAPIERISSESKDTVKGLPVNDGLRVKGNSRLTCEVSPSWKVFQTEYGIDDKARLRPSMKFLVFFDGKLAFESPIINPIKSEIRDEYRMRGSIRLDIPEGTKSITLVTRNAGFFEDQNIGIWIDPVAFSK